jgi:uncharacterized protein YaiI (UPF0178 family)
MFITNHAGNGDIIITQDIGRGVYGKGPKPYQTEDRVRFVAKLIKKLSKFAGI